MHDCMWGPIEQGVGASESGAIGSSFKAGFAGAALLLVAAYLLGGSAAAIPGRGMIIELIAVALLAFTVLNWRGGRPSLVALIGIAMVLCLPLAQLIPLPPAVWAGLPGREVARDVTALIDPTLWRPLSLDPNATTRAWFALWVPVAMFLATMQMPERARFWLVIVLIGIALLSGILGLLQISVGNYNLYPFESDHEGLPIGLFANRNHQAALMYASLSFVVALTQIQRIARRGPGALAVATGIAALLIATIFATGSRAGMVLMVLALLLSALIVLRKRLGWRKIVAGLALLVVAIVLLFNSGVVQSSVDRLLTQSSDGRYEFWPEVLYAVQAYFPVGSGVGTFQNAYQATEQLAAVGWHYVNHAHNDYLEVALEAGIPGALVLILLIAIWAGWSWRAWVRDRDDDANLLSRAASIAILCLMLHGLVDYPLRTFAHLTLLGMLAGLLCRPREARAPVDEAAGKPEGSYIGALMPRRSRA
ncbi:O-antigen ligase family protein [Sphingomonas sp. ASY06-1R]|uniref:O-antigen ligase family protein n=1 Tax=Sphingomonas sp. ASY06-1R TaxID=3445771 RepID=UPI003FA1C78B